MINNLEVDIQSCGCWAKLFISLYNQFEQLMQYTLIVSSLSQLMVWKFDSTKLHCKLLHIVNCDAAALLYYENRLLNILNVKHWANLQDASENLHQHFNWVDHPHAKRQAIHFRKTKESWKKTVAKKNNER